MAGTHRRRRNSYYSKRRRRRRPHPYRRQDQPADYQLLQQEKRQHNSSGSSMDGSESDAAYISAPLPLLDISIAAWLPFPELSGAWRWCSAQVTQSLDWVKDTVFPSRIYQRELRETKDQLLLLHQQIEQLKAQTLKIESSNSTPACKCSCQSTRPVTTSAHQTSQPLGPTPTQPFNPIAIGGEETGRPIPPQIAPPPPPPPLPPPPPPISLPVKAPVFKKKAAKETGNQAESSKEQPMVTLSDIMNVKLKKVTDQQAKQPSVDLSQRAVVTLTDIMNIQLKRTFRDKKSTASSICEAGRDDLKSSKLKKRRSLQRTNDENSNAMVLRNRISQEALQFRGSLRKVSMVRSPGGTPLKARSSESQGTGLTPLMTKALRRKFRTIRTPSPSALLNSTSPSFNTSN